MEAEEAKAAAVKKAKEAEEAKAAAVKKANLRGACIVYIGEVADSPPLVIVCHHSLQAKELKVNTSELIFSCCNNPASLPQL